MIWNSILNTRNVAMASDFKTVLHSGAAQTTWTATKNCWIIAQMNPGSSSAGTTQLKVNGVVLAAVSNLGNAYRVPIYVKKGFTVEITGTGSYTAYACLP